MAVTVGIETVPGPACRLCAEGRVATRRLWITTRWRLRRTTDETTVHFLVCPVCDAPPDDEPTWRTTWT